MKLKPYHYKCELVGLSKPVGSDYGTLTLSLEMAGFSKEVELNMVKAELEKVLAATDALATAAECWRTWPPASECPCGSEED
jgi:hypothetical protein